jgi:hypothetical protein
VDAVMSQDHRGGGWYECGICRVTKMRYFVALSPWRLCERISHTHERLAVRTNLSIRVTKYSCHLRHPVKPNQSLAGVRGCNHRLSTTSSINMANDGDTFSRPFYRSLHGVANWTEFDRCSSIAANSPWLRCRRRDISSFHSQTPTVSHLFSSQKIHALHSQRVLSSLMVNDSTDI